jgi:hypothetical protein
MPYERFNHFWEMVYSAEDTIRTKGYGLLKDHVPIAPWDREEGNQKFLDAYEDIKELLRPLSRERLFIPPVGTWGARAIVCCNAHQALMYMLNPIEFFMAAADALKTDEYLQIKNLAFDECRELGLAPPLKRVADSTKVGPKGASKEELQEWRQGKLMKILKERQTSPDANVPFTQEELMGLLGCSQSTVCRDFKKVFGGWKGYLSSNVSDKKRNGISRRDDAGNRSIDGISDPNDDEDDR